MDAKSFEDKQISSMRVPSGHSRNSCSVAGLANHSYDSFIHISIRITKRNEGRIDDSSRNKFTL